MKKFSICFANKQLPTGGSGTFMENFRKHLIKKKIPILKLGDKKRIDYILITGSNIRNIILIIKHKLKGSKIINRVDGKNWIHKQRPRNIIDYIYCSLQNLSVLFFQYLSNKIIYQSNFIKKDWNKIFLKKKSVIIYNGAKPSFQLRNFSKETKPILISIEGSVDAAFQSEKIIDYIGKNYKYEIYGKVSDVLKKKFRRFKNIIFYGTLQRSNIQKILNQKKKYIFLSLEMFAPCPNSVIEALNYGIPVIGYDQGSMRELLKKNQGKLLKVSKDFDFNKKELFKYIDLINKNYKNYNSNLKKIDNRFKLDYMLNRYESEIFKT